MNLTPVKANMTELEISQGRILFSYKTPVAFFDNLSGVYMKTTKKWSNTTTRHINQWVNGRVIPMPQEFFDNLIAGVK